MNTISSFSNSITICVQIILIKYLRVVLTINIKINQIDKIILAFMSARILFMGGAQFDNFITKINRRSLFKGIWSSCLYRNRIEMIKCTEINVCCDEHINC